MNPVRVVKGKVVGNTVVLEEPLPEGTEVEVMSFEPGDDADFVLTDEMRAELREAAAAAKRGEVVDMEEFLAQVDW